MDQAADGHGPAEKDPFAAVGRLNSSGARIRLPYGTFTAIDTWDDPSLCVVDTYDLTGDDIQFVEQRYNRPELVPVAKAIESAEKHDYPAVLAYCARSRLRQRSFGNCRTAAASMPGLRCFSSAQEERGCGAVIQTSRVLWWKSAKIALWWSPIPPIDAAMQPKTIP
jgi:hypothetical protein